MTDIDVYNGGDDNIFEGGEFVMLTQKGGDGEPEFVSGGYKVNSFFLSGRQPIMMQTFSGGQSIDDQSGGKVSTPFENLAVPAGLFYINQKVNKKNRENYYKPHETASDDIIDKLFGLIDANKKQKKKTKKQTKKINNKKSRKNLR